MTLTYELDLSILKMYLHTIPKMKFVGQGFRKLEHEQDRHTDRHDGKYYHAAFAGGKNDTMN